MSAPQEREVADVVVVGGRVAGAATAIELARRGRRVVVLDAATFPSDTLSTHLVFPTGVAEFKALGVLDPLLATGTPKLDRAILTEGGHVADLTFSPSDGVGYALCPRRTSLDHLLVQAARAAGADVREATKVVGLITDGGRVTGVRWEDRTRASGEIGCRLVVGADGRRSTIAELVGAGTPYRRHDNGRGFVFAYVDDPAPAGSAERAAARMWRVEEMIGAFLPTDDRAGVVLLMPPKGKVDSFGQDLVEWEATLERIPALKERIGGGARRTRIRKARDTFAYFRRSSGPGWALVGDAGHFKDPVIAQGIRDAVFYARRLALQVVGVLDDPDWLDQRLARWELARDEGCLSCHYLALRFSVARPITPVEVELFRAMADDAAFARGLGDVFSRVRTFEDWLTYSRSAGMLLRALRSPGVDRQQILADIAEEVRVVVSLRRDLHRVRWSRRIEPKTMDRGRRVQATLDQPAGSQLDDTYQRLTKGVDDRELVQRCR